MEINKVASNDTRRRQDAKGNANHALDIARWDDEGGAARPRDRRRDAIEDAVR